MKRPFTVTEKTREYKGKKSKYYLYSISTASGLSGFICDQHQRKTIPAKSKGEAQQKVFELIQNLKSQSVSRTVIGAFGDYSKDYMLDGRCPIQRLIESEGKTRDKVYMKEYRNLYELHVATDLILCGTDMTDLSHGVLLRFRERLVQKMGVCSSARKSFKIVKQITSYAARMGDLPYDPGAGMGDIKDKPEEKGVFSMDEIRALFPSDGIGEWQDEQAHLAFLLAYSCGLRKGELLGLKWGRVYEDHIEILEQFSTRTHETKVPKKGKYRGCPVPTSTMEKLIVWKNKTKFCSPEDYVFCYQKQFRGAPGGTPFGGTWWSKNFRWPLEKLKIDYSGRNLTPHSLRHTANTQLLDKGYSRDKIRETLGWSSSGVQNIYTHGDAMDHSGQADLIDDILKGNPPVRDLTP